MLRRYADDTGSLPLAMLLTVIGVGVSVVLAGVVATEQRATRVSTQRDTALNAARSGIDVALANVRAARRNDGSGDPRRLPCAALAGATAAGGQATYTATVHYLAARPPGGDIAWAEAHRLACSPGTGVGALPAYAMIVSTGRAGTAARTLTATYAFTSTVRNDRIEGGVIKTFSLTDTSANLCVTAGPAPAVNTQLGVEACDPTRPGQLFTYQNGLTIGLKGTGLCADGRTSATDLTERLGNKVTLQTCATEPVPHQQWSQNDHAAFVGTDDGRTHNSLCWNIEDGKIVLDDRSTTLYTCENQWGEDKSFFPAAEVGSGRAGAATGQLVNSEQFGRCIDVTSDDVNKGYLVIFPCKQSVTGVVLWNQTWQLPQIAPGDDRATGVIWTTFEGTRYCLASPGTTGTADRGDGQPANVVRLEACTVTGVPAAHLAWTVHSDTGRWTTSYRIESTYNAGPANNCLAAADQATAGPASLWYTYNLVFSKLVLAPCSGSDLQKWNAISRFYESSLTDVTEP